MQASVLRYELSSELCLLNSYFQSFGRVYMYKHVLRMDKEHFKIKHIYRCLFSLPDCLPAARKWLAVGFQWPRTGR